MDLQQPSHHHHQPRLKSPSTTPEKPHHHHHHHHHQNLLFFFSSFPAILITRRELTYYALVFFLAILLTFVISSNLFTNPFSFSQPRYFLGKDNDAISNYPSLEGCDFSYGRWIRDENYPLRTYTENCPFLDPGFRCHRSGRPDVNYLKWRWQPYGCDLPRFNATELLERTRNGRIVFAGDSIGRNQWESLLCMLSQGVSNLSTVYEENGNPITKHKGFLSIRFQEYNLTVQYYRLPFLVVVDRPPKNTSERVRRAIRVDKLHWFSSKWVGADILVFSAGHWWNQDKTANMGWYFQEENKVNTTMDVKEAFQKSLQTWKTWALQNLDPERSRIFFRSYSPVHYRDGTWNDGGHCDTNVAPETNHTTLEPEPLNNLFISDVVKQMQILKRNVQFVNITYLTEFRKDGHPSRHREPGTPVPSPQDCSHWCLPGIPDTWNELLYAYLLSKGFRTRLK